MTSAGATAEQQLLARQRPALQSASHGEGVWLAVCPACEPFRQQEPLFQGTHHAWRVRPTDKAIRRCQARVP